MILIDPPRHYKGWSWASCHMGSDTSPDELIAFGLAIGLKLSWFQTHNRPHFDLSPKYRRIALLRGAVEVTTVEWVRRVPKGRLTRDEIRRSAASAPTRPCGL